VGKTIEKPTGKKAVHVNILAMALPKHEKNRQMALHLLGGVIR